MPVDKQALVKEAIRYGMQVLKFEEEKNEQGRHTARSNYRELLDSVRGTAIESAVRNAYWDAYCEVPTTDEKE